MPDWIFFSTLLEDFLFMYSIEFPDLKTNRFGTNLAESLK